MQESIKLFSRIYLKLTLLTLSVGLILRIVLLFNAQTIDLNFAVGEWLQIFLLGGLNDLCIATISYLFLWLYMMSVSDVKYAKPWGYILLGAIAAAFCYVTFFNTIFDEYGSAAPLVASIVFGYWLLSFVLRLFLKTFRHRWTIVWFGILVTGYVGGIILNGVCEYFFWNEFGVRYNFIAVDYLIYTSEVVGNIMESYPIVPMVMVLILVTLITTWYMFRLDMVKTDYFKGGKWKMVISPIYLAAVAASVLLLSFNTRFQTRDNVYVNELQASGAYKFYEAFISNDLDYKKFYLTLPDEEAKEIVYDEYGSYQDNLHSIVPTDSTTYRNIVFITIESMSASFMEHFGNGENLTPTLDSLYNHSLAFDKVYATGNRTVRGLEAVTLSLPPRPGQSIIKRPNNSNMYSTGAILRDKGYSVKFFYGGNSYFDNMETFFAGNGYEIVDKRQYSPEEITFDNIWGVCDEDAYNKVIKVLSEDAKTGKPFFAHILSVSNHRPFTYPDGKIDIPNDSKLRAGGVMYTDYALGKFFERAKQQPWFDNTIFLITADHCASSAGKTEIPLDKYHIPALIYAPGLVKAELIKKTVSQIDLVPTLLSILNIGYDSHFFGKNVLDQSYKERAFIATYQDLGYLEGDTFTILSPVRRYEQYKLVPTTENPYSVQPLEQINEDALKRAISLYQTSSEWNKR